MRIVLILVAFSLAFELGYRSGKRAGESFKPAEVQELRDYCAKIQVQK